MATRSDLVIRKALLEDAEALREIGDVKGGKDYLLPLYKSFLEDKNIHPLVAVLHGKVVGFYMSHLVDDGQTSMKRAGRVHPSYRNQGIFHALGDALDEHTREACSSVKYELIATNETVDRASHEYKDNKFREILRKRIQNFVFNTRELKSTDQSKEEEVTDMTCDDVKRLFANEKAVDRLFPQRRVFNFFVSYRIMATNIQFLVNDTAHTYATAAVPAGPESDPSHNRKKSQFISDASDNLDIITCSYHHPAAIGITYEIDIYATSGFSYTSLRAHIRKHVENMRQLTNDRGVLMVTFDTTLDENKLMAILKDFGISKVLPFDEKYKVLYERCLDQ